MHVDVDPGDRASKCLGLMEPVHSERRGGEFIIYYRCTRCGMEKRVGAAPGDDADAIASLA